MKKSKEALEEREVSPRRYFHPPLSDLGYVPEGDTPISEDVASRILCLPLYDTLTKEEQRLVARILLRTQKYEI
jgi:dTDP-4-amino-4,6-dideoxygalactose transaminase